MEPLPARKKITLTSPPLPGGTNSFTTSEATLLTSLGNGKVVFAGDNEGGYGELWVSDGSQAGTFVLDQQQPNLAGINGLAITNIAALDNIDIYSEVTSDGKLQLHKTDGTYAGTSLVYDFGDINTYNNVNYFKTINGIMYFELYNNAIQHTEIWRTDGTQTGTYQVKDLGQDYGFASDFMALITAYIL